MTCLTEDNNNLLMWSHYADSHQGICVEYDLKRLNEDPYKIVEHLFPVIYEKTRKTAWEDVDKLLGSFRELNKAIDEGHEYDGEMEFDDLKPLFLKKGNVWEYEKEWRILYTRKKTYDADDEGLYSFNLKFPCVKNVYLGCRIHPEIRNNIIEICNRLSKCGQEVNVHQAKVKDNSYDITFEKIPISST